MKEQKILDSIDKHDALNKIIIDAINSYDSLNKCEKEEKLTIVINSLSHVMVLVIIQSLSDDVIFDESKQKAGLQLMQRISIMLLDRMRKELEYLKTRKDLN